MMKELSSVEQKLLLELMKNSASSDRELARKLGMSQPTITRLRNKLFNKELLRKNTVLPSFSNIGLKIMAFTFMHVTDYNAKEKMKEFLRKDKRIIYSNEGEGMKQNLLFISLHPGFEYYQKLLEEVRQKFGDSIRDFSSFLSSMSLEIKPFTLEDPVEEFYEKVLKGTSIKNTKK